MEAQSKKGGRSNRQAGEDGEYTGKPNKKHDGTKRTLDSGFSGQRATTLERSRYRSMSSRYPRAGRQGQPTTWARWSQLGGRRGGSANLQRLAGGPATGRRQRES